MHPWWRPTDARSVSDTLRTDGGEEAPEADGADEQVADDSTDESTDADDDERADAGDEERVDANDEQEGADTERTDADADRTRDVGDADSPPAGDESAESVDRSNVEVTDAGEVEPATPTWEEPDFEEIPEFEVGGPHQTGSSRREDPTAGRPNEARSPGDSRIKREGTDGYVVALELCARLPDDVRLPAEAADLVPAAVEAELEEDVQSFATAEFDNPSPTVDTLDFVERDGEVWLRLRLGVPPAAFADLDPDVIRSHALQELEGMF